MATEMRKRSGFWRVVASFLFTATAMASVESAIGAAPATAGQSLYLRGMLPSGAPVEAERENGLRIRGMEAACVNCHQRSGFGSREGRAAIPPITGRYLFRPLPKDGDDRDISYVEGMRGSREPYIDETLARAIREGINSEGKSLGYLMPRFELNDADMAALIGYQKSLDQRRVPGVTDTTLHFATIITPDADPVKRSGMLAVLKQFFAERNVRQMVQAPRMLASGRTAYSKSMFMVHRRWELHVWELTGPAQTWEDQLKRHLATEPVMAVISGLGGSNWAPVHAFCEHETVPCLFPNVEVPPADADRDFYSVYFSKGMLLEAELIASRLINPLGGKVPTHVEQIYRAGDSGEVAAKALTAALKRHGIAVRNHVLARGSPGQGVAEAVRKAPSADALILWLRPPDLAVLDKAASAPVVYMSGLMGGLERSPLPSGWRERTRIAYPFDLPDKRRVRVDFPLGWFRIRHIPVVAEQVQADTNLACGLLAETLSHMTDNFVRDYLVERLQDVLEHRVITGYYQHLTLATGQRFAAKGGYMVHFAEPEGTRLVADSSWIVP